MLDLKGSEQALSLAKAEVEALTEVSTGSLCHKLSWLMIISPQRSLQREVQLPSPASRLRPEVYQTVSSMTNTFIEPGTEPVSWLSQSLARTV